jgi:hypothetical protein
MSPRFCNTPTDSRGSLRAPPDAANAFGLPSFKVLALVWAGGDQVRMTLTHRIVFPALAGVLTLAMTACGSSGAPSSTLRGRYLPGTTSRTWTPLINVQNAEQYRTSTTPVGLSEWLKADELRGEPLNEHVSVDVFEFRSTTLASRYYNHPLVGVPLATGPTGVPSPSRDLNFLTVCVPSNASPNLKSVCSDGVGTMALRSNVVVLGSWTLLPTNTPEANISELPMVARYTKSALTLLSIVGLSS